MGSAVSSIFGSSPKQQLVQAASPAPTGPSPEQVSLDRRKQAEKEMADKRRREGERRQNLSSKTLADARAGRSGTLFKSSSGTKPSTLGGGTRT